MAAVSRALAGPPPVGASASSAAAARWSASLADRTAPVISRLSSSAEAITTGRSAVLPVIRVGSMVTAPPGPTTRPSAPACWRAWVSRACAPATSWAAWRRVADTWRSGCSCPARPWVSWLMWVRAAALACPVHASGGRPASTWDRHWSWCPARVVANRSHWSASPVNTAGWAFTTSSYPSTSAHPCPFWLRIALNRKPFPLSTSE